MRIKLKVLAISTALTLGFSSGMSLSAQPVGKVVIADPQSQVERSGPVVFEPIVPPQDDSSGFELQSDDTVATLDNGYVLLDLEMEVPGLTEVVIMGGGIVRLTRGADGLICHVIKGPVMFNGSEGKKGAQELCTVRVNAGKRNIRHHSTQFLIDERGEETSLFVMEGSVEVSNVDPNLPATVDVVAGEWLLIRRGDLLSDLRPMRYRRTDVMSGNSECIYSWCRLTRSIDIEPPNKMRVLTPPPPNPPGRQ